MNLFKKNIKILGVGVFLFVLYSCNSEDEKLTNKQLRLIDKLARQEIDSLRPIMDSLCDIRREKEFQTRVDSLLQVRLKELETKMNQ